MNFMPLLVESFLAVTPVFLLILLGYLLRKKFAFNEHFVAKASQIQFYLALPALVLVNLLETNLTEIFNGEFIGSIIIATLVIFFLAFILSLLVKSKTQKGPFIQGSYRANMFIIGLALVQTISGEPASSTVIAMLAIVMPLYNIFAVIVLSIFVHDSKEHPLVSIAKKIFLNPLIWAVIIALILKSLRINLPQILLIPLGYLKALALPLGLLTIGMSLRFSTLGQNAGQLLGVTFFKLILYPSLAVFLASLMGVSQSLWVPIFLTCGAPTAIASFAMTKAMKNDAELAAQIIALTTAGAIITLTLGVTVLSSI
jgi:malonate transporter